MTLSSVSLIVTFFVFFSCPSLILFIMSKRKMLSVEELMKRFPALNKADILAMEQNAQTKISNEELLRKSKIDLDRSRALEKENRKAQLKECSALLFNAGLEELNAEEASKSMKRGRLIRTASAESNGSSSSWKRSSSDSDDSIDLVCSCI